MEDIRFPIGKYYTRPFTEKQRDEWLLDLKFLPAELEMSIQNLDAHQLNTPYREGGWTVQQLVHHVADSHINAYIRFKLGLTETNPPIKPYNQDEWAMLSDVNSLPLNISITLLHALHLRWVAAIQNLTEQQWQLTVYHPEQQQELTLWYLLGSYAWHGKHHTAHIKTLKDKMGW